MGNAAFVQTSFHGGEWAESAQGRMDRQDYRSAMNRCFNSLPIETGAWSRRPGTRLVGRTRAGAAGRLIKFDFQEANPYNMEFTDGHLRLWAGADLVTPSVQYITQLSVANPAEMFTELPHGWSTGDVVRCWDLGIVAPQLQNRLLVITVTSTTSFTIADYYTGTAINGAVTYSSPLPTMRAKVGRVLDISTSYQRNTHNSWENLRSVQTEKQAVLLNGRQPQILSVTRDPGVDVHANFELNASNFLDGPYLDAFTGSVTPSALLGNITLVFAFAAYSATKSYNRGDYVTYAGFEYKSLTSANLNNTPDVSPTNWKRVSGGDQVSTAGFTASDIGRLLRLYSEPAEWASGTAYVAGNIVSYGVLQWVAIAGSTGVIPGSDATKWALAANAARWTWARVLSLSGAGQIAGGTGVAIGDLTSGGGVAGAFNGSTSQAIAASAASTTEIPGVDPYTRTAYVGKNYTASGAQTIAYATVYPTTDHGFMKLLKGTDSSGNPQTITLNLRAKATLPSAAGDGTLLGSTSFADRAAAATIQSNDTTTAWNYVWIEIIASASGVTPNPGDTVNYTAQVGIAQVVFFNPNVVNGATITVQIAGDPLLYTTPIRKWRLGVYSDTTGWPKCGTYHEGRLWLSGAVANRIDSSKSNDPFNFAPTEPDGSVTPASAIAYTFNSADSNAIFWMEPVDAGIICGTQAGEWLVQATTLIEALSPSNIKARRQTKVKCANIQPVQTDHTLAFIQAAKRRLIEMFPDVYSGKFAAPNLSWSAPHLMGDDILELGYQQDLMPVIWVRTGGETLIGLSYKRESLISKDGPTIAGWHWHTLGHGRAIVSITVGPSVGGDKSTLSLVTRDTDNMHYVEMLADLFTEDQEIEDGWHLDGAVKASSYQYSGIADELLVYGFRDLNGKTVAVFAGGLYVGDFTVSDGQITLPYGDGISGGNGEGLFTRTFVEDFGNGYDCPIHAGYSYTSQGQIVRPAAPSETGTRQGPGFGKSRRVHEFAAQLVKTRKLSFGTVFTNLKPILPKSNGGTRHTPLQLFSGVYADTVNDAGSQLDGMLCWQISGPFPAIIAAVGSSLRGED